MASHLRAAFDAGCRIQAWHLNDGAANSNDGRWDTLSPPEGREPAFGCEPHLYRVHPEDEAKALEVWDFRMPTRHLPLGIRFAMERLISATDPQAIIRMGAVVDEQNKQLRVLVDQLSGLARRAIPFLEEGAAEFEDDGQNEPLELSREIREAAGHG